MSEGYLYVATGSRYIEEAIRSAKSLKLYNPSAKIALVSTAEIKEAVFNQVIVLKHTEASDWKGGFSFKVNGLLNSPFEKTFFVDTDTYFTADTSELFDLLNYKDLLICHSPNDISRVKIGEKKLEGYTPYNTGVIVFKQNERIASLFRTWKRLYQNKTSTYLSDQPAFMEALLQQDIKNLT